FRISSDIIPFASHPICTFNWQGHFKNRFKDIGNFIKQNKMRISMHPDQFTLINSLDVKIFKASVSELEYHADVLDLMGLDNTAKIQIHVGGVYGDKKESIKRFIQRYKQLPQKIANRLAIENDERSYSFKDCFGIHKAIKIPVIFDVFHHKINPDGIEIERALELQNTTWKKSDGIPIVDYSSQEPGERTGKHAETIDIKDFKKFLNQSVGFDFDIMLEIKDKEKSATKAIKNI
ncbi:MAG: UV DNA damage repair endonuclease UvsE, partial [bacterium]|nr:UV DNA damage repair endonuclease UvsE [bacterium]